ncbi:MAG: phosphotransferase [Steroidobacteraceae bacterium]
MVEDLPFSRTRELSLAEALADALAHVPGYARDDPEVELVRLPGGSVNCSYRVCTPVGRFVLRLSPGPDAWLTSDRSVERELHARAAAAGIAPHIVRADERDRWLITELVDGRLWTSADFATAASLTRLGDTLRRLHAVPPPASGRFDLLEALAAYASRIESAAAGRPRGRLGHYLEEAAQAWRTSGASQRPVAILHHDLHASNLIESPDGLKLIDWECAAVSDPLLDIACILSYYEAARAYAPLLLKHSCLEAVTPPQLAAAVWLFELHTFLWYQERRLRLVPTEAELDAQQRLSVRVARGIPQTL